MAFSSETYAILRPSIKKLENYAISGLKFITSISSLTQSPTSTNKGDLYISNVEGTLTNFGGHTVKQGDGLIYNGSGWDKIAYSELIKLQESFIIKDKYSDLTTTSTRDLIAYIINDENISGVDYKKGFYLFDKASKTWSSISSSGDIASNTTLGNVIIKKDGGIEVDNNGNIWIGGYTKTETIDPITGDKTTVTTFNGVTDTKIETPTGDVSEKVDVGGLPFGSSSDVVTNPDGSTTETITETVGGQTTTTVINKDSSGNETGSTTTTEVGGSVVSTTTKSTSTTTDGSGNTIKVNSTTTTTASGGSQISSTTTTTTPSGDTTTVDKVENKDPSGITKIETTTTDPTGSVSTDTTYDAPSDMFMDRNESDSLMDDIFNDFGW